MHPSHTKTALFLGTTTSFFVLAQTALAATPCYTMLAPIGTFTATGCYTLKEYLNGIFETVIGIAGILAVVMIVICGIRLMSTPSVSGRSEAKECIYNALFGVLIAIGSWLLLNTINPQLLKNDAAIGVQTSALSGTPAPEPGTPSGILSWETGPNCPKLPGKIVSIVDPSSCSQSGPGICCKYFDVIVPPPKDPIPPPVVIIPSIPLEATGTNASFTKSGVTVAESAGSVTLTVRRSGGGSGTVDYTIAGLTATAGLDFTGTSGTLTFPDGVYAQNINIPILNDALVEESETFKVSLSNPTGAIELNASPPITVTITDNDVAAIDVTPPVIVIASPGGGVVVATTSVPSSFTVTEDMSLSTVDIEVKRNGTGTPVFSQRICSRSTAVCPLLVGTFTPTLLLGKYISEHFTLSVHACDKTGNCGDSAVDFQLQLPCVSSSAVTCLALKEGLAVPPAGYPGTICSPQNGLTDTVALRAGSNGTLPGAVQAYAFKLTDDNGGGRVAVLGGAYPEYPAPPSLAASHCAPVSLPATCVLTTGFVTSQNGITTQVSIWKCPGTIRPTVPLSCTYYPGGSTGGGVCDRGGCSAGGSTAPEWDCIDTPLVPPKQMITMSISPIAGDMSSGASTVWNNIKRISGRCGSSGGLVSDLSLSFGTSSAPGICHLELDRVYYANIQVIPQLVAPPTPPSVYSVFWSWLAN